MKKVSVIIPCYNAENFIERCIESLVHQTIGIENLELIFVNDASTDGTLELLKDWEGRYPDSIVVIDCVQNHRTGGARNIGLQYATADYISFMDNDDRVELDMYETFYNIAVKYDCDVVGALYERVEQDGTVYDFDMPEGIREIPVDCRCRQEGAADLPGEVWNKIYRRELIFDNDLYFVEDLNYPENYWEPILDYYIKRYYVVDRVMYHHIVNNNSILLSGDFNMHKDRLAIEIRKLEEIERRGLADIHSEEMEARFIECYYINTLHIFFSRNTELDYEVLDNMKREVLSRYPDYKNNSVVKEMVYLPNIKYLLGTLEVDLSADDWSRIKENYDTNGNNSNVSVYMDKDQMFRYCNWIYESFVSYGAELIEMLIKYGMGMISSVQNWNEGNWKVNWGIFWEDYRALLEGFQKNDRIVRNLYRDSVPVCQSEFCDIDEFEAVVNELEHIDNMQIIKGKMEKLLMILKEREEDYKKRI